MKKRMLDFFQWFRRNKLRIAKYIIALIVAIVWLLPFLGVFMASIRPLGEITRGWWNFEKFTASFANYIKAWSWPGAPLGKCLLNSIIVTASSTIMVTLLGLVDPLASGPDMQAVHVLGNHAEVFEVALHSDQGQVRALGSHFDTSCLLHS